ncbi:hypothetical protein [Yoonia sp. SDW83-1]|uniref:hypothetical protein n=1 Tax=Yoonia sp. SDW83-1 TaxID=3366945 RepID=UPI00398C77EA
MKVPQIQSALGMAAFSMVHVRLGETTSRPAAAAETQGRCDVLNTENGQEEHRALLSGFDKMLSQWAQQTH